MKRAGPALVMACCLAAVSGGCGNPAVAPSPAAAQSIEVPEQIAPPTTGSDRITIEEITPEGSGDPVRTEQSVGGRDLCDPSVSEAVRRRYGVDCEEIERHERETATRSETAREAAKDPLLQPRDPETQEQFEDLGLGKDVPPTVILQR